MVGGRDCPLRFVGFCSWPTLAARGQDPAGITCGIQATSATDFLSDDGFWNGRELTADPIESFSSMNPLASDPIEQFSDSHERGVLHSAPFDVFCAIWVATMTQFYLTVLLLAVMLV